MDLLSFCPRVLWSYSSPPALVSGHGGATFFVPGLTTALFRMRILPPGQPSARLNKRGINRRRTTRKTSRHRPPRPMFNLRSGEVVSVVPHDVEFALVEVVVPDIAVRDLELASG